VITIQAFSQAMTPQFLMAVNYAGSDYILRELQPSADRLDLKAVAQSLDEFSVVVGSMADLAAWAQLRASGHCGAAPADALMAHATSAGLESVLLAAARQCSDRVNADWDDYVHAYDDSVFTL
jgi:hypothetical protein